MSININENDSFDKHVETQYANKPYYRQMKRIWRLVKKIPNPEKSKKLGFYLQLARKVQGSAQNNEKIIKDVFGKSQEMSPAKFIRGIFSHAIPEGEKLYIKPETAYQSTQRLLPDKGSERDEKVGLNKTIQVSVFGDIYDKILDKYKGRKDADDLFRAVNRYLSSHFANAAGFIRWTEVSPNWIHIDAFQTDFFSSLKSMAYQEKDNPEIKKIVAEFRKHEDEFFKTAVSYVVRTSPSAKIFTASTPEIVAAVENVRGDVKLKKYYHQLPKKLGFKLITLEKLKQILRTRPGKKAEALIKKFEGAVSKATGKKNVQEANSTTVQNMSRNLIDDILLSIKQHKATTSESIDSIINRKFPNERVASAYHQHIGQLAQITQRNKQAKTPDKNKQELTVYLKSKEKEILDTVNKVRGAVGNIWWSNRQLIFEHASPVKEKRKILIEDIKLLSRY